MSGPLKFWLTVILALAGLAGGAAWLAREEPPSGPAPHEAAAPAATSAATRAPVAGEAAEPSTAGSLLTPFERSMARWAASYRENLAPVASAVENFEADPEPPRAGCNALLTATYGASRTLEQSPDPDIESALRAALEQFSEAGKFCLQLNRGLQDTYLLLARGGITLAESILEERYGEAGVPGLAEPMEGGTAIGQRAVDFAKRARRDGG